MSASDPSEVTLALNAWWRKQSRWRAWAEAARELGIPKTTFRNYFFGAEPSGKNRATLHEATGLDLLADVAPVSRIEGADTPSVDEVEDRLTEVAETLRLLSDQFADLHGILETIKKDREPAQVLKFKPRDSAHKRAEAVERLMYQLVAALETFRSASGDREVLRQKLHGPDVGYLLSLMNALQDEDKYSSWDAMSSYRPLGIRR
jgi:hypothetical protein